MQRSRFGILGAAAAMLSAIGSHGMVRGGIRRVTSDSKAGRQMMSAAMPRNRSKYSPHIGAKEQERAKRCVMTRLHRPYGELRSAPTMQQMSKREYELRVEAEQDARYG